MARFDNPTLAHRTRQIAMDGSQKLPQRLLAPIAARLAKGQGVEALSLAVAAWVRWQVGMDDAGEAHKVDDPLAGEMAALLSRAHTAAERIDAILGFAAIVPTELARSDGLRDVLVRWLTVLEERGALAALQQLRLSHHRNL
jgi:fructuronate reductase